MDGNAIKKVVNKKLDGIRKNTEDAGATYDMEAIHDLRVGYKKLRAFIRLLSFKQEIKIPEALKDMYQKAGQLRNRQIYFQTITDYCQKNHSNLPSYLQTLSKQIEQDKNDFKMAVATVSFGQIQGSLEQQLPAELDKETAEAFIAEQEATVHDLFRQPHTDTKLHSIRKHLKDVLYCIQILTKEGMFSEDECDKKEIRLKKITDTIGNYNDISMNLLMLEEALPEHLTTQEGNVLRRLQELWTNEKLVQKTMLEVYMPGMV